MESYNANSAVAAAGEPAEEMGVAGETVWHVKVMTEEQVEVLRKQISIYGALCEQLAEMHRAIAAHRGSLAGMRLGNPYCDDDPHGGHHRITARHRWTPTHMQLQILESIFYQGDGTPGKQRIEDITVELSQYGQISETSVYNWFQNRRARLKRKQQGASSLPPNNGESEPEAADEESPTDKRPRSDGPPQQQSMSMAMAMGVHNSERISEEMYHHFDTEQEHGTMYGSNNDNGSGPSGSMDQMSLYEAILSNPGMDDQFLGMVETSGSFSQLWPCGSFDMYG
uniref:Uncharacterized protein n=1 Tax=Avena sativa TaxID=4498 RepID=A0ACD5T7X8_AVESA